MRRSLLAIVVLVVAGCSLDPASTVDGGATTSPDATTPGQTSIEGMTSESAEGSLFPDVVGVEITHQGEGIYRFDVTISSPYDSNERYADAWRVLGPDGTEFGVRVLTHPHANEQPFTRSLDGVEIPESVTEVTIEGRDSINGWGGRTMTADLNQT